MSGPSDKARFYLERSVPQLQEFKEKKIFTGEEIRNIVKKRSDFEHKILGRGTRPVDFARYAAWEMGLEELRKKRCKRLNIKSTAYGGQSRIIRIFDRGTKKHPGDVALWLSYLDYTRACKAIKKFRAIMTSVIRLHPTKPELWILAAKYTWESEADINGARSFMQRGTRFCTNNSEIWIEYAKLEMIYLAKITNRSKTLQLRRGECTENNGIDASTTSNSAFDSSQDIVAVPDFHPDNMQSETTESAKVNPDVITEIMNTPALNGAIPLAIFDKSCQQPFICASVSTDFFNMFASFPQIRCIQKILQHVVSFMLKNYPTDSSARSCYTREPLIGLNHKTPEFPAALGTSLHRITESMEIVSDRANYSKLTRIWLEQTLALDDLDSAIQTVIKHTLRTIDEASEIVVS
ncbi:unnamed protein product [Blumeria hordei]|uniref:U3 small nucleolar RNA-associated protein 6 N-terminal domain-containing protein n=1 Tax=Blumeria hordei TaxID=2867405 RepID=A0A383V185_BLUHO|nr:unnamed protein product [Blumeria hordei]